MNIISRVCSKPGSFIGKLLTTGLSVWLLGVAFSPTLAATVPSPVVDQAPLIIQKPLPPNITLMLDDSGSMDSDYMPDTLSDWSTDGFRNADINFVYYSPTSTYTPPPKADGSSYLDSPSLTGAFNDGFLDTSATDITSYSGSRQFYTVLNSTTTTTYTADPQCKGGRTYNSSSGKCEKKKKSDEDPTWTCKSGDSGPSSPGNICTSTTTDKHNFFTYTTGASNTRHYVGASGDCALLTSATEKAVCDDSAATRQNVANWFSYYRTRILMSKSGVMSAFSTIDPLFRVGFGSINGQNNSGLPSNTVTINGKKIATVRPFGDGSGGTQHADLWSWLADIQPNNSTPLRLSLDAVGKYYATSQPWQTSATDTTELACRQSYTILTTDGFWNGGSPSVGNIDNTTNGPINGPTNPPFTYTPAAPFSDGNSNTLADVAMKYWVNDLRPTTNNEVPTNKADPAFWQHMVTFTLGLGFSPVNIKPVGTTDAAIFAWANGGSAISGFSWPDPISNSVNNIADLEHAAVNGHGGFASAKSPDEFSQALKKALQRAAERVGTGASLAANSTELKTGTFAYQGNYYTGKWTGDLKAIAVDPNDGSLSPTPTWRAADPTVLPAFGSREIYTYNPAVTPAVAVAFKLPASLSASQQTALGKTAADQLNMINYLRGDNSLEQSKTGGTLRIRETPLGDIVDSQPVYVGQPDPNIFTGETFSGSTKFAAYAGSARSGQILVAANDGMLHVFNADTGVEDYAYLPAAVITSGLKQLADPDYGITTAVPHQYFNDGELTVADVYYGSAWHAIAVGTTGRGAAKAIYALDVTTSTPKFLWERSAGDALGNQDYIGQMTGKPIIAQTADGAWSVLMGNGYNSKKGVAALLQFAVTDGTLTVHTTTDVTTGNGLAAPAVWLGDLTNGISTIAYAGDALGQVWSFGLNDGSAATPSSVGAKLFSTGTSQPITSGLLAGKDPATGNLWVFFGTGQYLSTGDLSSTTAQAWYGLIVQSDTAGLAVDSSKGLTDLVQRSIIAETTGTAAVVADASASPPVVGQNAVAPARAITQAAGATSMSGKSGWYINLLSPSSTTAPDPKDATKTITTYTPNAIAQGERIVTPNQFQGNQLLATTRIPQATDLCNPSGRGWIISVDPFTGTSPLSSFFDLNGDGQINSPADTINVGGVEMPASGIGFSSLPNNPIFVGGNMLVSFDNGNATSIKTSGSSGTPKRVSWRELINQ